MTICSFSRMVFRLISQETTMYFKDLSSSNNKSLKYRAMAKFIRYAHFVFLTEKDFVSLSLKITQIF